MQIQRYILSLFFTLSSVTLAEKLPIKVVKNVSLEIDHLIESANKQKAIQPNDLVDDATFLRRSYLVIAGRIPTHEEAQEFFEKKNPAKREQLIEALTYSNGFNSHQFNFYANLLRLQSQQDQFGLGWHLWLKVSIEQSKPYDQLVREMLSAEGHCANNPAVGYYLRDRGMLLDNISNTSKVFLGTQIGCAQCHDHPFEDWTQKQYYQLAAYGANVEYRSQEARSKVKAVVEHKGDAKKPRQAKRNMRKEARNLRTIFRNFNRNSIASNSKKSLRLPKDYKYNDGKPNELVQPAVLFGESAGHHDDKTSKALASWVTDRSNPMFSKVIVNRLWKQALGYGLVEPIDNWTDRSKISHPEALELLVEILHESDFDTREVLRVIYHTKLFQRETCKVAVTGGRTHDFRGPVLRRMSAEQLYDSLLTLQLGNIDQKKNEAMQKQWQAFGKSVNHILDASPAEIIQLDELADKSENATRALQQKARKLRTEKATALEDGNKSKAERIQKKLSEVQQDIRSVRQEKRNEKTDSISLALRNRLNVRNQGLYRSSELPTPFRAGSFMRDFGASDRNTTNAQHTHASIPQALSMLNGKHVTRLASFSSALGKQIKKSKNPEERLNILFLHLYSAIPTEDEHAAFISEVRERKNTLILAKAILNSKRFLFIQ